MKKAISFFVLLNIILQGMAQTSLALKAGVNISSITGRDINSGDFRGKDGFYAGAAVNAAISKVFSIQPEMLFSSKGYLFSTLSSGNKTTFNYFCIPVLASYKIYRGLYVETGPQFALLLSTILKTDNNQGGTRNITGDFREYAFSWCFGTGYVAEGGLGFEFRYNIGLNSISADRNTEAKFRVLRLGLSYRIAGNRNS